MKTELENIGAWGRSSSLLSPGRIRPSRIRFRRTFLSSICASVYERKLTMPNSPSFCTNDFFMIFLLKKMQCETAEIAVSTASLRLADL